MSNRRDPTRTTTLRKSFEREMVRRFRSLQMDIKKAIVDDDGFALTDKPESPFAINRKKFELARDADKVDGFMAWLKESQSAKIFDVVAGAPTSAADAWSSVYIKSAYNRGVIGATAKLRKQGATVSPSFMDGALNRPVHADRAALAYTRTFSELEGVTAAMDQQVSRILGDGLAKGLNPLEIARTINDRVAKIGITRARMIARTEVISAHAEATLNMYKEAGVQGVEVEAEWLTAIGACKKCLGLKDGGPYTIKEARGLIPVHPNCKCAFAPKVINGTGIILV